MSPHRARQAAPSTGGCRTGRSPARRRGLPRGTARVPAAVLPGLAGTQGDRRGSAARPAGAAPREGCGTQAPAVDGRSSGRAAQGQRSPPGPRGGTGEVRRRSRGPARLRRAQQFSDCAILHVRYGGNPGRGRRQNNSRAEPRLSAGNSRESAPLGRTARAAQSRAQQKVPVRASTSASPTLRRKTESRALQQFTKPMNNIHPK